MYLNTDASLEDIVARLSLELADEDAPRLGVHTLSEFVYCPRAGLISARTGEEDSGSEFLRAPALGGLPTHDVDRIEAALQALAERMKVPIAWNLALWLLTLAVGLRFTWLLTLAFVPALYSSACWLQKLAADYQTLKQRFQLAHRAASREPDWNLPQPQPIEWWSLIRAGFDSVEKQAPLFDSALGLGGKPWRVLHRGSVEIPVLRIRVNDEKFDARRDGRLRRPQLARLAAYAYLLHRCERADSRWAVVLFGKSDEGIAVPVTDEAWRWFFQGLREARGHLRNNAARPGDRPDPNRSACVRCPHGKPQPLTQLSIPMGDASITPFGTETPRGFVYHSTCGDHFRSIPPHEKARELGLPCE